MPNVYVQGVPIKCIVSVWRTGKMQELRHSWRRDKENVDQSSSCDLLEVEQRDISDSEI